MTRTSMNPTGHSSAANHTYSGGSTRRKSLEGKPIPSSQDPKKVEKVDERGIGGKVANALAGMPVLGRVLNAEPVRQAAKRLIISNNDFDKIATEKKDELKKIVGSPQLGELIDAISPAIARKIKSSVLESYPNLAQILESESTFLESVVKALILKAAVKVASQAKIEINASAISDDITPHVLGFVLKMFNTHVTERKKEFNEVDEMEEGLGKVKAFRALFGPAAKEMMKIAFPQGKQDLGLNDGFASSIWQAMCEEALPEFLAVAYRGMHQPNHHTQRDLDILKENCGGAALKAIAKVIAEKGKALAPEVLANNSEKIAEGILEKLVSPEKRWLKSWLGEKIKEVITKDSDEVKKLWDYAEGNIESIMIHALATVAKKEKSDNGVAVVLGTGFKIIDDFLDSKREEIESAIDTWKNVQDEQIRTKKVAKLFKPLVDKVLKEAGLEDNAVLQLVRDEALPALFLEFYQDMKKFRGDHDEDQKQLKEKLLDKDVILNRSQEQKEEDFEAVIAAGNEAQEKLYDISGVSSIVEDLSKACGALAGDVAKAVKEYAYEELDGIAKSLNENLFDKSKLSKEQEKDFAEGLKQFITSNKDRLSSKEAFSQELIKAAIFKIFLKVAEANPPEKADPEGENKNKAVLGNVIHRVLSILVEKIPTIDVELDKIRNDSALSEKERKEKAVALFQPFAEDFLALAGDDVKSAIPVPTAMQGAVLGKVKDVFLPAVFHEIYAGLNTWRNESESNEEELGKLFGDGSGGNAAGKIAGYIKEFIPYYMETHPETIANLVCGSKNKYFSILSEQNQTELKTLLVKNIGRLGKNDKMKKTAEAIGNFSRAAVLKIFNGLSHTINKKETEKDKDGKNHFFLNTAIGFITTISEHVKRINKIPTEGRMSPAHKVEPKDMLEGFRDAKDQIDGNLLHPALMKDLDPTATDEEKKAQRINVFFKPLAEDLIRMTGVMDPETLPEASALTDEFWVLFREEILPEVLYNIFQEVKEPHNINQMMLKVVEVLKPAEDDLYKRVEAPEEVVDHRQDQLNEELGKLILQMVELLPDIWTKTIFKSDKIKSISAQALGRSVRNKLDSTTIIELMNLGFNSLNLTSPEENRGKTQGDILKEKTELHKQLRKNLTNCISEQVKDMAKEMIKTKWDKFQADFDRGVKKCLGKPGLAVKRVLDHIFRFIFITCIGALVRFLIFNVFWFFVDLKINQKSEEIIKDAQMPIHENLLYKLTDEFAVRMGGKRDYVRKVRERATADKAVMMSEDEDISDIFKTPSHLEEELLDVGKKPTPAVSSFVRPAEAIRV